MGYAISWYAVKHENAEKLFDEIKLKKKGEIEEFPESLISTAKINTGWQILWYNEFSCPFLKEGDLRTISKNFDIISTLVEEHSMFSSSEYWSNGECKWHISHEGINGTKAGLKANGVLPDCFTKIKTEIEENQRNEDAGDADVDYIFEIPLMVCKSIVGFKHDEDCSSLIDNHFEVLSRISIEEKKGLFKRIFGK